MQSIFKSSKEILPSTMFTMEKVRKIVDMHVPFYDLYQKAIL